MAIFCFNLLLKAYWACFCEILVILGLFFRICHHPFLFNLLADISFCCIFLPMHVVGLVVSSIKLPIFGLFFISNLALLVFAKQPGITGWHSHHINSSSVVNSFKFNTWPIGSRSSREVPGERGDIDCSNFGFIGYYEDVRRSLCWRCETGACPQIPLAWYRPIGLTL